MRSGSLDLGSKDRFLGLWHIVASRDCGLWARVRDFWSKAGVLGFRRNRVGSTFRHASDT